MMKTSGQDLVPDKKVGWLVSLQYEAFGLLHCRKV